VHKSFSESKAIGLLENSVAGQSGFLVPVSCFFKTICCCCVQVCPPLCSACHYNHRSRLQRCWSHSRCNLRYSSSTSYSAEIFNTALYVVTVLRKVGPILVQIHVNRFFILISKL